VVKNGLPEPFLLIFTFKSIDLNWPLILQPTMNIKNCPLFCFALILFIYSPLPTSPLILQAFDRAFDSKYEFKVFKFYHGWQIKHFSVLSKGKNQGE